MTSYEWVDGTQRLDPPAGNTDGLLSRAEVIAELCSILGMAYHAIGNYDIACDGICPACEGKMLLSALPGALEFRHHPGTLAFIRQAVTEKLDRDYPDRGRP